MKARLQTILRLASAGVLALACMTVSAQTWRWTDPASGRTMYSDQLPEGKVRNLVKIERSGAEETVSTLPYATKVASERYPVVLFTGKECIPCNEARQLLATRGVPFTERSVQTEADQQALKALVGDVFVPALKVGSQQIRGFDAAAYNNLLDLAGYPKASSMSAPPTAAPTAATP